MKTFELSGSQWAMLKHVLKNMLCTNVAQAYHQEIINSAIKATIDCGFVIHFTYDDVMYAVMANEKYASIKCEKGIRIITCLLYPNKTMELRTEVKL